MEVWLISNIRLRSSASRFPRNKDQRQKSISGPLVVTYQGYGEENPGKLHRRTKAGKQFWPVGLGEEKFGQVDENMCKGCFVR
jgi:hypothetical protein